MPYQEEVSITFLLCSFWELNPLTQDWIIIRVKLAWFRGTYWRLSTQNQQQKEQSLPLKSKEGHSMNKHLIFFKMLCCECIKEPYNEAFLHSDKTESFP